ncbi:MAG: (d)CMP kinase [Chromatiales bacterium]|nr:(d)CMP kinase [Chromatiales bacterium]
MAKIPVIAIDGPAGVGKSTIACRLAKTLGYNILISGVLYRIFGMQLHQSQIASDDKYQIESLIAGTDLRFVLSDDGVQIYLNDTLIGDNIYQENYAKMASAIGESAVLRTALLPMQRGFRRPPGLVADGRDMASVVFPDAMLKIFLQADINERCRRRQQQLELRGVYATLDTLYKELLQRDQRDSERSIARLKIVDNAIVLDTTKLSIIEVVNELMGVVESKLNERGK